MFGLTSCFLLSRNKNIEMRFQKEMYFYICLKLHSLPPRFHFIQNEVPSFNWKHWKRDFIIFSFWFVWENIFTENVFKNPTKHISITIFYFQWKWKQKTAKPNTPLIKNVVGDQKPNSTMAIIVYLGIYRDLIFQHFSSWTSGSLSWLWLALLYI